MLGGLNNYQYAPNPIGWIDPFGLSCKEGSGFGENASSPFENLTPDERRALIEVKTEVNAERWVRNYENTINQKYPNLNAHFVDKHGPDIPLDPNLRQRAIDGAHPRTGRTPRKTRPQESSQFKDWRTQMHVLNEASSREARGLSRYTMVTRNARAVTGSSSEGIGHGYSPNSSDLSNPYFNEKLDGWIVRYDPVTGEPFSSYPTKKK